MTRFTETLKWDDPWFRSLSGIQKLVFLYVIDRCNNAGFWEEDEDAMAFQTKLAKEHIQGAWKGLGRGLIRVGGWVWVRRFLRHQRNDRLNPENKAHIQIIGLLGEQVSRFSSSPEFCEFLGAYKGLLSPTSTVQVQSRGIPKGEKVPRPTGNSGNGSSPKSDEEFFAGLTDMEAYRQLNIPKELEKARLWCSTNRRTCTRRFFVNWLNRASVDSKTVQLPLKSEPRKQPITADEAAAEWLNDNSA